MQDLSDPRSKKLLTQASKYLPKVEMCHPSHVDTWNGREGKGLMRLSLGSGPLQREPAPCVFIPQTRHSTLLSPTSATHFSHTHQARHPSRIFVLLAPSILVVVVIPGSLEMAPIAVGDTIPDGVLSYLDEDNTSQKFHVHEELKGKKVVLLAVPGAFTPTCRYLSLSASLSLYLSLEVIWEG